LNLIRARREIPPDSFFSESALARISHRIFDDFWRLREGFILLVQARHWVAPEGA
jgi:hypothetical protein